MVPCMFLKSANIFEKTAATMTTIERIHTFSKTDTSGNGIYQISTNYDRPSGKILYKSTINYDGKR